MKPKMSIRNASATQQVKVSAPSTTSRPRAASCTGSWQKQKPRSNERPKSPPTVPNACAAAKASLTWPRICGSPSTIESSPEATRNKCFAASRPWWRYTEGSILSGATSQFSAAKAINRALEKEPEDRPASAAGYIQAIRKAAGI